MMDPNAPVPPPSYHPPVQPQKKAGFGAGLVLALGCFGFLALSFVGIVILAALSGDGGPSAGTVEQKSVLRIKLSGAVPEYVRSSGLEELFGGAPVTVRQHVFNLEKAASDERIKGVLLELGPLEGTGYAKVEELRDALVDFKKSGKFVVVFSEMLSEKEYALALAADTIVMPKDSWFEFNGLATDVSHYPGLLEKLGIEVQYFRYGKYKSVSGEQTGAKAFSEPVKEMINHNLATTYAHFVDAVASYRKLEPEQVKALIEEGRTKSDWALEHKLIDQLGYQDEVEALLRTKLGVGEKDKLHYVAASRYRNVTPGEAGLEEPKHTVALIYSSGLIVAGKGSDDPFGGDSTQGSDPLIKALRRAADDEDVKAILLRVDSPGGAGLGCDYVRREVARAKEKKPVIVSMSDVAASGGYWVSMDATAIVAQPTTATGSIGIYTVVPNLGGLYEKLGLNNETFKVGAHADALIAARKFSDEEARQWDADLLASYNRFVSLAAEGRKMDPAKMQELAQGRTWLGAEAKENGLVDEVGGFKKALEVARAKANLPAGETVGLKLYDKKRTLLEELFQRDDEDDEESPQLAVSVLSKTVEASGLRPLFKKVPGLSALAREVAAGKHTLFPMAEYQVDYR